MTWQGAVRRACRAGAAPNGIAHDARDTRMTVAASHGSAREEFDIVPTVEANGNKPISPLSVAAEPLVSQ